MSGAVSLLCSAMVLGVGVCGVLGVFPCAKVTGSVYTFWNYNGARVPWLCFRSPWMIRICVPCGKKTKGKRKRKTTLRKLVTVAFTLEKELLDVHATWGLVFSYRTCLNPTVHTHVDRAE